MWELIRQVSHGRYSARRISLVVMSAVMAFFMASVAISTPVYAAEEAQRNGATVSYQGNSYTEVKKDDLPKIAPSSAQGAYKFEDATNKKAYFIYTADAPSKAATGSYVIYDFTPPANYSNTSPPASPVEVTFVAGTSASTSDCGNPTLAGIGWIVCPVVNWLAGFMDWVYNILSNFLVVNTITANTSSPVYQLWSVVRDVANICFVIAMIVIIYSQLTSIGITNYGIKKTLPRLIIAAILVNISYWICALAVDASNILGYGIHSLFVGVMDRFSVEANYAGITPTWQGVTTAVLGGVVGGYALFMNGIYFLVPMLVGAAVAALVALVILAARQALITLLILIAPLAFVAYILPNTEKYFTKWRETLMTMLLLFPIFSAVFSGAQIAGMAIIQTAGDNIITLILGLAVQVAPIVITPLLIRLSGNLIGKIAGMVNDPSKGVIDRSRQWAEGMSAARRNRVLTNQNRLGKIATARGWSGKNPIMWANRTAQKLDSLSRNQAAKHKELETAAENRFNATKWGQDRYFGSNNLETEKKEIENRTLDSERGRQLQHRQGMADVEKTNVQNRFNDHDLGKSLDKAKRRAEIQSKRIESDHQASWDNAVQTDASLLELEITAKRSADRAAGAKVKLEKMHAEIAEQGHNAEHILNLRGVSGEVQAGLLNIAHDINKQQVETAFTSMAKTAAEHKLNSQTNEILLKNSVRIDGVDARTYAAGIGSQSAVLASAVAKERKEFGEEVSYQRELANHFKLSAGQIESLAMAKGDVSATDDHGNTHVFSITDDHIRDMAAEDIFTVGSHGQKMDVLKSTGVGGINYGNRRTIQQAAIKSGIGSIAPAINDKTLDDIINGKFKGDESWQYHSLRQVLEGRLKAQSLASANADSLKLLFTDVDDPSTLAGQQFAQLINDGVVAKLAADPTANAAQVRSDLIATFTSKREAMRQMAAEVLRTPTIRQGANDQSVDLLKSFAGGLYTGP